MMSNYNWCHNPDCHTNHTTDRVRGVKGKKVLRTRKIKVIEPLPNYYQGWENHFCKMGCLMSFIRKNIRSIIAIAPVHEPSEIPIHDPVKERVQSTWNENYYFTETRIKPIEQT